MWVVHKKLAEIWHKQKTQKGSLSKEDQTEMIHCLEANMRKVQKLADLENQSLVASMVNDTEWQHDICKAIDKIHEEMRL